MFVIDMENVLTMSESEDMEMICYYQDFIRKHNKDSNTKLDRKMGHLGNVNDAKKLLEELFNMNPASKE
jgi:hypothetical protein